MTGLELSEAMLERARARTARLPAEAQGRLEWVQGDMSRFDLPGRRFGLIFVAYNSFWLLDREAAQGACLRAVARHLAPEDAWCWTSSRPTRTTARATSG